ncbi:MAG: hypothetical protein GC159_10915 [Phycisphaera sp.]|nr:hypothetical protein [Phycisphaera sp.]
MTQITLTIEEMVERGRLHRPTAELLLKSPFTVDYLAIEQALAQDRLSVDAATRFCIAAHLFATGLDEAHAGLSATYAENCTRRLDASARDRHDTTYASPSDNPWRLTVYDHRHLTVRRPRDQSLSKHMMLDLQTHRLMFDLKPSTYRPITVARINLTHLEHLLRGD